MSYYVITKVRVDPKGGVVGALVRTMDELPGNKRVMGAGDEADMTAAEIADLLLTGEQAYVGVPSLEEGFYELTDEVRSTDDDEPLLESFDESGETSAALTDLPRLA